MAKLEGDNFSFKLFVFIYVYSGYSTKHDLSISKHKIFSPK